MRITSDSTRTQYQQVVNGGYLHFHSNIIHILECPWRQDIVSSEGKRVEGVTEFAREEKKGYTVITLSTISGHKDRSA